MDPRSVEIIKIIRVTSETCAGTVNKVSTGT